MCRGEADREVSVEAAVCKLLLGDVAAAEAALGLGPTAQHEPDPEIQSFVQVSSCLSVWLLCDRGSPCLCMHGRTHVNLAEGFSSSLCAGGRGLPPPGDVLYQVDAHAGI